MRPRGVWAGVGLGILGAVIAGLGVALGWWILSLAGVVILVLGATVGARSGGMYDVHGVSKLSTEVAEVRDDVTYQGVAPGDMSSREDVHETSRRMDRQREEIIAARAATPRPPLAPLAGGTLLLVGVVLLVAQSGLYPTDAVGQANARRALAVAIVALAVGLRYLVSDGRHLAFAATGLLSGVALVVAALVAEHSRDATVVLEITCGPVIVACAVVGVLSPRTR